MIAPENSFWSEMQIDPVNPAGASATAGFGAMQGLVRLADDFVVPAGQTNTIGAVDFYAYKSGAAITSSPFISYSLRIWRGRPGDPGSEVIFGDDTTNRLESSTFTGSYRIFNSRMPAPGVAPETSRAIWRNRVTVSPALTLSEGTYWLDWAGADPAGGTHYHPSVTIPGVRTMPGWNARQVFMFDGVWFDVIDRGNPSGSVVDVAQDFPFDLYAPQDEFLVDGFESN